MSLQIYYNYLATEKRKSENTKQAYRLDLADFQKFITEKGIASLSEASGTDVVSFLLKLKKEGKSTATTNRKIASLRHFYGFLESRGEISQNPTVGIKSQKVERKEIQYLTLEEVDKIFALPDNSLYGIRDRAILELLDATGMRVSELVEAKISDLNLRMGFISCTGEHGKARIIPIGRPARAALEVYIYDVRNILLKGKEDDGILFINHCGSKLTRQGLWKILKGYAEKAGIEHKLTPQILRNTFAVHMIQNGADLKSLQEMMGHEGLLATQGYLSVKRSRIKDVYDKTHPRA